MEGEEEEEEDEEQADWHDDPMDESAVRDTLEYPVEPPAKKRKA